VQDNLTVVQRFVEEVINHGRMDSAAHFVCEDVVEQVPLPGQGPGLEGLKDILGQMRTAFPDLDFSIKEQIAEGEKVASRFEWTGTHQQQFLGVPATGRPVRVWGVVIDRLEGGRIKDTRIMGLRGIVWVKNADFEPETPLPIRPGKGPTATETLARMA